MEKRCQNPLCRAEAVTEVRVSIHQPADESRALCAACLEVYTWGMQHASRSRRGLLIEPPPREKGPEPLYRVVYVIDVNAASVRDAAEYTHRIMIDPASLRPVLHVLDHKGRQAVVDLAAEPSNTEAQPDEAQEKARQFVLAGGTQCPACGGQEIDFGPVELDAECAYQEASCRHCEARFCGVYRLAGYGLHVGDSLEIHTIIGSFSQGKDGGG